MGRPKVNLFQIYKMAISSAWNGKESEIVLGIGLCPLSGDEKGPAPELKEGEDIIDECIRIYRFNSSMRSFPVKGAADRTLVYLTVYMNWFIKKLEDIKTKKEAHVFAEAQALRQELKPEDKNHFFAGLLLPAKKIEDNDKFKKYLKQLRSELSRRLVERLYSTEDHHAFDYVFWLGLSRRYFMSLRYEPDIGVSKKY